MNLTYPVPVYRFLGHIQRSAQVDLNQAAVLDCGAGGKRPPLALFARHGLQSYGIDHDPLRLQLAGEHAREQGLQLHLQPGDMRSLPFPDNRFDFVYEFYSMCHLSKSDTRLAIAEMYRVLKPGGLCYLGFMSAETWPLIGKPNQLNEWTQLENGREVTHSVFTDAEAQTYLTPFEVLVFEKDRRSNPAEMQACSLEKWMQDHTSSWVYDRQTWQAMYARRVHEQNYTHLFFLLRKMDSSFAISS